MHACLNILEFRCELVQQTSEYVFHFHQNEAKTDVRNIQRALGSHLRFVSLTCDDGRVLEPLSCMAGYTPGWASSSSRGPCGFVPCSRVHQHCSERLPLLRERHILSVAWAEHLLLLSPVLFRLSYHRPACYEVAVLGETREDRCCTRKAFSRKKGKSMSWAENKVLLSCLILDDSSEGNAALRPYCRAGGGRRRSKVAMQAASQINNSPFIIKYEFNFFYYKSFLQNWHLSISFVTSIKVFS